MARRRRRRGVPVEDVNPVAPPRALAAEWRAILEADGFRDIEYTDGSLLGVRAQEPERAPSELDLANTPEYYSRAAEWLHAADWRGRRVERLTWAGHCEGESIREIAARLGHARSVVHRRLERLTAECDEWWQDTAEERAAPPPERGRPRKEEPRREQLNVKVTRDEMRALRNAAQRAGAIRPHQVLVWVRATLLFAAESTGFRRPE